MNPFVAASAALVLGLAATGPGAMGISLTPSSTEIRVGDHFNLLVAVNEARGRGLLRR